MTVFNLRNSRFRHWRIVGLLLGFQMELTILVVFCSGFLAHAYVVPFFVNDMKAKQVLGIQSEHITKTVPNDVESLRGVETAYTFIRGLQKDTCWETTKRNAAIKQHQAAQLLAAGIVKLLNGEITGDNTMSTGPVFTVHWNERYELARMLLYLRQHDGISLEEAGTTDEKIYACLLDEARVAVSRWNEQKQRFPLSHGGLELAHIVDALDRVGFTDTQLGIDEYADYKFHVLDDDVWRLLSTDVEIEEHKQQS